MPTAWEGETMSVSLEQFRSESGFATYDAGHAGRAGTTMFHLQCRSCGFEPPDGAVTPPRVCPKCHAAAWERYARPGSILEALVHAR